MDVHSFILVNIVILPEQRAKQTPRMMVKRGSEVGYILETFLWGGYDLAPNCKHDSVESLISMRIGKEDPIGIDDESQFIRKGKNPIWNRRFR